MNAKANSNLVPLEIVERIGAVYIGGAEAAGVPGQLQQTVKGRSPGREVRLTLMAPEAMGGRARSQRSSLS